MIMYILCIGTVRPDPLGTVPILNLDIIMVTVPCLSSIMYILCIGTVRPEPLGTVPILNLDIIMVRYPIMLNVGSRP